MKLIAILLCVPLLALANDAEPRPKDPTSVAPVTTSTSYADRCALNDIVKRAKEIDAAQKALEADVAALFSDVKSRLGARELKLDQDHWTYWR